MQRSVVSSSMWVVCWCSAPASEHCQAPLLPQDAAAFAAAAVAASPASAFPSVPSFFKEPGGNEAIQGWWSRPAAAWTQSDALLAAGALVVCRARAAVKSSLGFSCSAGIAHSKILAKLGSGLHKPAQQTVVPGERTAQP
jgi:nucleotidyltransferase/DNA polymerase involved in DNA repair